MEVGSSFPCVETKPLKMEKENVWNALKQEIHDFISSDRGFGTDLMIKQ